MIYILCIWEFAYSLKFICNPNICGHSWICSVQFSSIAQSCPTLCDPMDCTTPGLPVHHHLLEFTQTHVLWAGDAIQPSHPLSSPSPPAFNLSQHQSFPISQLFASGGQSIGASASAPVLPMNIQDWSLLELAGLIQMERRGQRERSRRGQTDNRYRSYRSL